MKNIAVTEQPHSFIVLIMVLTKQINEQNLLFVVCGTHDTVWKKQSRSMSTHVIRL